jgi:hypothetical protein
MAKAATEATKGQHRQTRSNVSKDVMDAVALAANIATLIAFVATVVALVFTARQLLHGRKAASAATLVSLNESFRQAWLQFSNAAEEDARQYAFSDVMNLLEMACAIFGDKMFVGHSGKLIEDYLCHAFILIQDSPDARLRVETMILTPNTFDNIVRFLREHREKVRKIQLPGLPPV